MNPNLHSATASKDVLCPWEGVLLRIVVKRWTDGRARGRKESKLGLAPTIRNLTSRFLLQTRPRP